MTQPPAGKNEANRPQLSGVKPPSARGTAKPGDSVPLPTGPFPTLPTDFGRYQVQKLLGRGQMGAVYLAHDRELERDVALKIARTSATGSPKLLERMKTEAKAAARIDDPRVCKVYEIGEIDGIRFIAQQHVPGEDLRSRLKRLGRKQPPAAAVALILELAKGLQAAHAGGVIHRDLKPENVMIRPDGTPVIMDFGLARVGTLNADARKTQAGTVLGTAAYMSVEQARGALDEIDGRSDLYALGVMLFELLTGEWPFAGTAAEIMGQKCVTNAPSILSLDPDLPPVLADICSGLLERRKEDRCPNCEELVKGLEFARQELDRPADPPKDFKIAPGVEILVRRSNEVESIRGRRSSRKLIIVVSTALTAAALLAGVFYSLRSDSRGSGDRNPLTDSFTVNSQLVGSGPDAVTTQSGIDPVHGKFMDGNNAGESHKFTAHQIDFQWCPPGKFRMGTPGGVVEEAAVDVTLTKGFWIGRTEVTQAQWEAVMGTKPWVGKPHCHTGPDFPAAYVSHGDSGNGGPPEQDSATAFCLKLTAEERDAGRLPAGWTYRLPTEAEWEYACRAGTTTTWFFGDDISDMENYGWWSGNAERQHPSNRSFPREVALKQANPWGLYDMHGNAWEWCRDWRSPTLPGGIDPAGATTGELRSARGSGWSDSAFKARSAARGQALPEARWGSIGFRLVLSPLTPGRPDESSSQMAEMSAFFPLGSTYTGTMEGVGVHQKTRSRVTAINSSTATLHFTNDHGNWEFVLKLRDRRILLQSVEYLSGERPRANLLRNIDIQGAADGDALQGDVSLDGTWSVVNPETGVTQSDVYVRMDFRRDK